MSELLIKLFIKNSDNTSDSAVRESYGTLGGLVGIVCNLFLCALKITVGLITSSISIVADGLNNLSDMGSSLITMICFKMAGKPADSDHPFGHGRMEYMSAFVVAMLILLVGAELLKSSLTALIKGDAAPEYSAFAIVILCVSVFVKLWMFVFNRKLGKKISSGALIATARDSLNDMTATSVILLSVIISMLVKLPFNLDAVMGTAVSLFILYSGLCTAKETLDQILGTPPDKQLTADIENTVMSFDGFVGIHDLIVHNYGPGRQFASVHVEVPQNTDIVRCHEQIDLCEKLIMERLNLVLVIHMDPIDVDNEAVAYVKNQIEAAVKAIDSELTLHDFRMTPAGETRTNLIFDVVVPSKLNIPLCELDGMISNAAKRIDPTYCCVVTFDNDFTGK